MALRVSLSGSRLTLLLIMPCFTYRYNGGTARCDGNLKIFRLQRRSIWFEHSSIKSNFLILLRASSLYKCYGLTLTDISMYHSSPRLVSLGQSFVMSLRALREFESLVELHIS